MGRDKSEAIFAARLLRGLFLPRGNDLPLSGHWVNPRERRETIQKRAVPCKGKKASPIIKEKKIWAFSVPGKADPAVPVSSCGSGPGSF